MDYLTFLILILIGTILLARFLFAHFPNKMKLGVREEDIKNIGVEIEKLKNIAKHNHNLLNEMKLSLNKNTRAKTSKDLTETETLTTKTVELASF